MQGQAVTRSYRLQGATLPIHAVIIHYPSTERFDGALFKNVAVLLHLLATVFLYGFHTLSYPPLKINKMVVIQHHLRGSLHLYNELMRSRNTSFLKMNRDILDFRISLQPFLNHNFPCVVLKFSRLSRF